MRQTIKGLLAAFAVMTAGAAPAMACGYNPCGTSYAPVYAAPVYTAPTYSYSYSSGCGSCGNSGYAAAGGWGYEALAEPTTQYYYVNQGPTYSGPGSFAPAPAYQEEAVPSYGYGYGYRHHYRPYYHGYHYGYAPRHYGYRYGYAPRHYAYRHWGHEGYYYGRPLVRRYY